MKLGLVACNLAGSWDLGTIISRCEATRYKAVQLRTGRRHGVEVTLSAAERAEVRDRFQDSGIRPVEVEGVPKLLSEILARLRTS